MSEEEDTMEKKVPNPRSVASVTTPKPACDSRKDNGSKLPRNGRKREVYRTPRPEMQKPRPFEKRPTPRSYQNDRQREEVALETSGEIGSAHRPGSKKANLSHLLNFTFAPRESETSGGQIRYQKNRSKWSQSRVKYNKEQFLQANCQFIVSEYGDYILQAADPDALVDWENIQQVRILCHEVPSCPICLYPPTAAKMTRCGHIYCWSCILHYLSLTDKTWRKCPICYESIHKKDLKSVTALSSRPYKCGDKLTLRLMRRERGSTYAVPKTQWTSREGKPHNMKDEVDTRFLKLLLASLEDVQSIVAREKHELDEQLTRETDSLECSYIEHALELVKEREDDLQKAVRTRQDIEGAMGTLTMNGADNNLTRQASDVDDLQSKKSNKACVMYASAFSDEEDVSTATEDVCAHVHETVKNGSVEEGVTEESNHSSELTANNYQSEAVANDEVVAPAVTMTTSKEVRLKQTDVYFFYQACDGQHIYLNSLNARCLAQEYGSLEMAPDEVTAKIVDLEPVTMVSELRQRLRYLSHLPLTCQFVVAELDLKPPVVSKETLHMFTAEIGRRKRQRDKKRREDRRHSHQEEPQIPQTLRVPSAALNAGLQTSSLHSQLNAEAKEFLPINLQGEPQREPQDEDLEPLSFARMLREGKARVDMPSRQEHRQEVMSPSKKVLSQESDDSDNEDKVPIPEFHASFGEAIQEALNKIDKGQDLDPPGGSKRKKGRQKKLLFTTAINRSK